MTVDCVNGGMSVGCYCSDETHCHRSILRKLIEQEMKG
jgi:uncharacterized protein YeaO (DUF488 family)